MVDETMHIQIIIDPTDRCYVQFDIYISFYFDIERG